MRQLESTKAQLQTLIGQAEKILCITHEGSGADGVMSVIAAEQWLTSLGKSVTAVFPGEVMPNLNFVKGLDVIEESFSRQGNVVISVAGNHTMKDLDYVVGPDGAMNITLPVDKKAVSMRQEREQFDLILCFEVPRLADLGNIYADQIEFFQQTPLVNIAANGANEFYAKLNCVDTTASSASEVLYSLIAQSKAEITPELATILLTGVIAGSESFLGENTTASAFATAGALQSLGGRQSDIIENLYKKKSLKTLKLWGQICNRLELDQKHRITRSTLQKTDFEMLESTPANIENLPEDILRYVTGSDIFVLFYEFKRQISVRIRTTDPAINWSDLLRDQTFNAVNGGVDVNFTDMYLGDVEKYVFNALKDYQLANKDLSEITGFKHCSPSAEASADKPLEMVPVVPKAPEIIPFEAPFQPHENAPEGPTKNENSKGWLKKSFPSN